MAALEIFSAICTCLKSAKSDDEESYDKEDGNREVTVTTNNVSNVTCCGGRATNKNEDDVYVKTGGGEAKTIEDIDSLEQHDDHRSLPSNSYLSQSNFRLDGDRFFEVDISYSASREQDLDCTGTSKIE